jgi:hypothetical protein
MPNYLLAGPTTRAPPDAAIEAGHSRQLARLVVCVLPDGESQDVGNAIVTEGSRPLLNDQVANLV